MSGRLMLLGAICALCLGCKARPAYCVPVAYSRAEGPDAGERVDAAQLLFPPTLLSLGEGRPFLSHQPHDVPSERWADEHLTEARDGGQDFLIGDKGEWHPITRGPSDRIHLGFQGTRCAEWVQPREVCARPSIEPLVVELRCGSSRAWLQTQR